MKLWDNIINLLDIVIGLHAYEYDIFIYLLETFVPRQYQTFTDHVDYSRKQKYYIQQVKLSYSGDFHVDTFS